MTFRGSSLLVAAYEIISSTYLSISMFVFLYCATVLVITLLDPCPVFGCLEYSHVSWFIAITHVPYYMLADWP